MTERLKRHKDQKDSRRVYMHFDPWECDSIAEFLESMALEGWRFRANTGAFFKFERMEPKRIRYAVEPFAKASVYDVVPDPKAGVDFVDYCEAAGWKFICMTSLNYIFETENEDAVPVNTDNKLKFDEINKVVKKTYSLNFLMIVLLPAMIIGTSIAFDSFFRDVMFSLSGIILILAIWLLIFTISFTLRYRKWKCINAERAELGMGLECDETGYSLSAKRVELWSSIILIAIVLAVIMLSGADRLFMILASTIFVALVLLFASIPRKLKLSRKKNLLFIVVLSITITIALVVGAICYAVFYSAPAEQFRGADIGLHETGLTMDTSNGAGIFGRSRDITINNGQDTLLDITVYESGFGVMIDGCYNEVVRDNKQYDKTLKEQKAAYGAERYCEGEECVILKYDKKIYVIEQSLLDSGKASKDTIRSIVRTF